MDVFNIPMVSAQDVLIDSSYIKKSASHILKDVLNIMEKIVLLAELDMSSKMHNVLDGKIKIYH